MKKWLADHAQGWLAAIVIVGMVIAATGVLMALIIWLFA